MSTDTPADELVGAPDRAGSVVRDQITQMIESAQRAAADIERSAENTRNEQRVEARDQAARVLEAVRSIEAEAATLVRNVAREADGLRAKLDRTRMASGGPSSADPEGLLNGGDAKLDGASVERAGLPSANPEDQPEGDAEDPQAQPGSLFRFRRRGAGSATGDVEEPADAEEEEAVADDLEGREPDSGPADDADAVEESPEDRPPEEMESEEEVLSDGGDADEEDSDEGHADEEGVPDREDPDEEEVVSDEGHADEEQSVPDEETFAGGETTSREEPASGSDPHAAAADEAAPDAGPPPDGSSGLAEDARKHVADKSDLELAELYQIASGRAEKGDEGERAYWNSLLTATVEQAANRPAFGARAPDEPPRSRREKKKRANLLKPLVEARKEAVGVRGAQDEEPAK